jgi:hypothetical protein
MSMRSSISDEEKRLGETMKATKVAICHFLAQHPSSVSDPDSMRRDAEVIQAYPISSRRHLRAMRSELDATIRELRRQVSLGHWPRRTYDLLVAQLRGKDLIDISSWADTDAERLKQILENGEIRRLADLRLATEYRDTIADEHLRRRLDELIASFEAKRGASLEQSSRPGPKGPSPSSKLSRDDLAFLNLLRRSAIASFEYAARTGETNKRLMEDRIATWRTIEIATQCDLKELERAFWAAIAKLRRYRLTEEEFRKLAAKLQEEQLIDISQLAKAPASRPRRGQ